MNRIWRFLTKKKVFISHAGVDNVKAKGETEGLMEKLTELLEKAGHSVVCSSVPRAGIPAGEYLHERIERDIKGCSVFLAIITDNYLRSPHCLYELSVARFLGRKVTPIPIYSNEHARECIKHIANTEWLSINLKGKKIVQDNDLEKLMVKLSLSDADGLKNILATIAQIKVSETPFVGMSPEEFDNLLRYCQQEGITKFKKGSVYSTADMKKYFSMAKTVYIVSTTGAGLLKTLKEEVIPSALLNGADIHVFLPDQNSQFCMDVAMAESYQQSGVVKKQNVRRIAHEFEHSIQYLNEAFGKAKSIAGTASIGTLNVYCSGTLLRQTLVMVEYEKREGGAAEGEDKKLASWGWVNMTMAPLRTTDTPTIAISDADSHSGLDSLISNHCKCMMAIAKELYLTKTIDGATSVSPFSSSSPIYARDYWEKKRDVARKYMEERRGRFDKVLIEVAAQHPLYMLRFPNEEFKARLDFAANMYNQLERKGVCVQIYVPGSLHKYDGITDAVSLSESGKDYMISQHGIPAHDIYGDDINLKYKGVDGVYNSADECYAASCLFRDEMFGRLICVCSPYQTMRKTFFFMEFGLLPECYGIAAHAMFHDPVSEYFGSLHHTVYEDHDWQDSSSEAFINSRKERMP